MDKEKMQLSFDFTKPPSTVLGLERKEQVANILCFTKAKNEVSKKQDNNLLKLYQSYAEKIYW